MRQAKVHVSIMGDEAKQKLALRGLQNAAGFLQAKIARRIDTRYTPRLRFELDQGVKHSIEISRILNEVLPRPLTAEEEDDPLDWEPDGADGAEGADGADGNEATDLEEDRAERTDEDDRDAS
jgi:ribosome-binding factor A